MDRVPKKVIVTALIVTIGLVLIFNHILGHHDEPESIRVFDIYQVEEFNRSYITISHREQTEGKIRGLITGGRDRLQVILDFDKTLTKYKDDKGNRVKSTHDLFNGIETVPKSYQRDAAWLYSMFGPIEDDPTISREDKLPLMDQWGYEYSRILQGMVMNKSLIEHAVNQSNMVMRDGAEGMLKALQDASVPVLIFSAGLGDVIKAFLSLHKVNTSNVHVISNFFKFTDGKIDGFKGKLVHTFNKDQRILEEIDFKHSKVLSERCNVILVGDSLGDASMADGMQPSATILRIGFLNDNINQKLNYYKQKFDIITANDESMNVTNAILKKILRHNI